MVRVGAERTVSGVALLAPVGMSRWQHCVWHRTGEMEGRELIVWFKMPLVDLVVVVTYCPTETNGPALTRKLWNWVQNQLEEVLG